MKEQVMIYEVKASVAPNATILTSPGKKYFYWNRKSFRYVEAGDYIIVVNRLAKTVLFTRLDRTGIPVRKLKDATVFTDLEKKYRVPGEWDEFIRLKIIGEYPTPTEWKWKSLGSSETTYLNGPRINRDASANRVANIQLLKELSGDHLYNEILNDCMENFTSDQPDQPLKTIDVPQTISHIHRYITAKGFRYQHAEIANFYLALRTKPFVILAGISGTGKTQLPRKFAEALGCSKEQVMQLAVRPDWTDSSDLLGYTGLDNTFVPKELTRVIQRARKDKHKPFFFILDEMNLARVEHYFSDFLSVIETRERRNGNVETDPILRAEIFANAKNSSEFGEWGWPQNLYLVGTVNMDETTHAFSRKVLDRANSIEMNDIDLNWMEPAKETPDQLTDVPHTFFESPYLKAADLTETDKQNINHAMRLLNAINAVLRKADLHFAYRVRDEIAFYLVLNKKYGLMHDIEALDFQLVQKILPRIHGSSERVLAVLVGILNLLEETQIKAGGFDYSMVEKLDPETFHYRRASSKILFMLQRFDEDRFTSFWL